ncbi:MAG TPA: hypothetical protein PLC52_01120 [Anaerolineales bacterium]|nr:hypothetical protein [Anaerolineales bacterium]HRQ91452.1 hypothetical protein [Anaerolineales bacterium]
MNRRKKKSPLMRFFESRPVISFIAVFLFSSPAFFFPSYSPGFLTIVIGLSLLAAIASINAGNDFKKNLPGVSLWTFGLLLAAARALSIAVFSNIGEALVVLLILYAVFISLHFVNPKLTVRIYEEQVRPTTRLGRGCLAFSRYILPIVGVVGAQIGRSLSRHSTADPPILMGGVFLIIAVAFTHPIIARYVQMREESSQQATGRRTK